MGGRWSGKLGGVTRNISEYLVEDSCSENAVLYGAGKEIRGGSVTDAGL